MARRSRRSPLLVHFKAFPGAGAVPPARTACGRLISDPELLTSSVAGDAVRGIAATTCPVCREAATAAEPTKVPGFVGAMPRNPHVEEALAEGRRRELATGLSVHELDRRERSR